MALLTNGSAIQARFLAGSLGSLAPLQGLTARRLYTNAMAFGTDTSWPQGYTQVTRAWVPPLIASGQIAALFSLALDMTGELRGAANMSSSLALDVDMTANANARTNAYATIAFDVDMTAGLGAIGNMSAVFDLVGRPSAVDISQEVWNGFTFENGLSGSDVLRILLAVAAGKSGIDLGPPVTVTFRDQDDTKDRVRAEMTDSVRDAVTVDGAL